MNKQKSSPKKIKKLIVKKTFGLANNLTEGILFFLSGLPHLLTERSLGRAMEDIGIILDGYDPDKLRQSFYNLKHREYLDKNYQITERGWQKIKSLTPAYQKPEHWDGKWYLVVFDIPEYLRRKRDILRNRLIDLDFGMLQKSIWLSSCNYLKVINKLVGYYHINDYVLTTVTSNIDNQGDKELANKVWSLDKINKAYQDFITEYKKAKKSDISDKFLYLNILKQDPQLPIELIPEDWVGERAARIAKRRKWI